MRRLVLMVLVPACIQDFPPPLHLGEGGGSDTGEAPAEAVIVELIDAGPVYLGHTPGDSLGSAVAAGTDLDGDGHPDLVLGARGVDGEGAEGQDLGAAWFIPGPLEGTGGSVAVVGLPLVGVDDKGQAGQALSSQGDFDGDGLDDLIIGAPRATVGPARAGRVAVFLGGQPFAPGTLEDAQVHLLGTVAYASAGRSLAMVGDATGDGVADLLIGADGLSDADNPEVELGGAWLVPGGLSSGTVDLDTEAFLATGWAAGTQLGAAAGAGSDLDGDGINEVLMGAWANHELAPQAGRVVLWPGPVELDQEADTLPHLQGPAENARLGIAVATGDVDGDGHSDALLGASGVDTEVPTGGVVYIVFGGVGLAAWDRVAVEDAAGARLEGSDKRMRLGTSLALEQPSMDGDTAPVLVGSPGSWSEAGGAWLFTEALTGVHASAHASFGFQHDEEEAEAGQAVALGGALLPGAPGSVVVAASLDGRGGTGAGAVAIAPTP